MHLLGTIQLRRLAEVATGRDFSGAFNEDVLVGAPEILLLSLDDINEALGKEYHGCWVSAYGITAVMWTAEGVLLPGNGLPTAEEQREVARLEAAARQSEPQEISYEEA